MIDEEDSSEEYYEEEQTYFIGCTCDHEPEQHGWGCCNVEGCECAGGWEE